MTDYLSHLAERSLSPGRSLRPNLPSFFEHVEHVKKMMEDLDAETCPGSDSKSSIIF